MLQTQPRIITPILNMLLCYYDNENYMFWVNINPLVFALLPKTLADRISTTKHYFWSLLFSFGNECTEPAIAAMHGPHSLVRFGD